MSGQFRNLRTRGPRLASLAALVGVVAAFAVPAQAQPVAVTLVLKDGDMPAGLASPVTGLAESIFVNTMGQVMFQGDISGDQFIWVDGKVVWKNSDDMSITGSGFEDDRAGGVSDAGGWVTMVGVGANDAIWTDKGLIIKEKDQSPGLMMGNLINFLYRPYMYANGGISFIASTDADANGSSDGRAIFYSVDGTAAKLAPVLKSLDVLGTDLIVNNTSSSIEYSSYAFSNDGKHHIAVIDLEDVNIATVDFNNDAAVVVDGKVVMQEGTASNVMGQNHDNFDAVAINNAGNYLTSGDGDGDSTKDEHIAYNGKWEVVEGDTVGGVALASGSYVEGLALTDGGYAAHVWNTGGTERLFFSCDASAMKTNSVLVLKEGDEIDTNNDQVSDGKVTDISGSNFSGVTLALNDKLDLYVAVTLDSSTEAVIKVPVTCCGDGKINGTDVCDDAGESATCNVDCTANKCGDGKINKTAMETCDDSGESATCDDDCTEATCGDGKINATAKETCDDSGESATCNVDCTAAACGDSKVNKAAGEDCDEAGVETKGCDADCTYQECGDGTVNKTAGEACDDKGESATCNVDCSAAACGDGKLNKAAGEECEDGNTADGDGCSAACKIEGGSSTSSSSGSGTGGGSSSSSGTPAAPGDVEAGGGCSVALPSERNSNNWAWLAAFGVAVAGVRRRRR